MGTRNCILLQTIAQPFEENQSFKVDVISKCFVVSLLFFLNFKLIMHSVCTCCIKQIPKTMKTKRDVVLNSERSSSSKILSTKELCFYVGEVIRSFGVV